MKYYLKIYTIDIHNTFTLHNHLHNDHVLLTNNILKQMIELRQIA